MFKLKCETVLGRDPKICQYSTDLVESVSIICAGMLKGSACNVSLKVKFLFIYLINNLLLFQNIENIYT